MSAGSGPGGTVRRLSHELSRSEERLRAITEPLADGVVVIDDDGTVCFHNPAAAGLLMGSEARTMRGRPLAVAVGDEGTAEVSVARPDGPPLVAEVRVVRTEWEGAPARLASLRDVTDRVTAERDAQHAALHDPLTGLPNRALLVDRVEQLRARLRRDPGGAGFAVMYLDLDGFKQVNDSLGHGPADDLLVALSRRLSSHLRPSDTIARLGGDEFAILVGDVRSGDDAAHAAERVLAVIAQPFALGPRRVNLGASLGIAVASDAGPDALGLLAEADQALYSAKAAGRSGYRIFDAAMHAESERRLGLERSLRAAVAAGAIDVRYQPILTADGVVVGVEALARWPGAAGDAGFPAAFLPVAARMGIAAEIDDLVLRRACADMPGLRRAAASETLALHVNLSPAALLDPDLPARVESALRLEGAPDAARLTVEVGEEVLAGPGAAGVHALRERGVRVVVDGFGGSGSSLTELHGAGVDGLKIDGRPAHGGGTRLIETLLAVGRHLGVQVIAKRVESAAEAQRLRALGCGLLQGFHLCPPLGAGELSGFLGAAATA